MSSLADSGAVDEYTAMVAAADPARLAYLVAERADILHASEAQVQTLYDGVAAGAIPVSYSNAGGWRIGDMPVMEWIRQQQQEVA